MSPYVLIWTPGFTRAARRFLQKHRELVPRFNAVLHQLEEDPFDPSLRLHALSGRLRGMQAVSVTYAYRIVLCVEVTEREVILHNIGTHDEVYG